MMEKGDTRPKRSTRNIPILVWIILAAVIAWIAYTVIGREGTHVTPQGGTMPQQMDNDAQAPRSPDSPGSASTGREAGR